MRQRLREHLPGAGFRNWLAIVFGVFLCSGIAFSLSAWIAVWSVGPLLLFFILLCLFPVGTAIWVAGRHIYNRRFDKAAVYGSIPVVALITAITAGWIGYNGVLQLQMWQYYQLIVAAQKTGSIVNKRDVWIDPGPPTRARFAADGSVLAAFYILYAEDTDHDWLNSQAFKCQSKLTPLGRHFYRVGGSC